MVKASGNKQGRIDWERARQRLRVSELALMAGVAEDPARVEAVFRRRAAHMAALQREQAPRVAASPALLFTLREEEYAIALAELAEVVLLRGCTCVPGAAALFMGVINLRGELRPVIDLGRMLLGVENGSAASGFVLMLRGAKRELGLRVDGVTGLRDLESDRAAVTEHGKYTKRIAGEAFLLLDTDKVLAEIFSTEEPLIA